MKRKVLHSIALSMAFLLFVGQVGLTVHKLYCACKGQWEAAFFQPEDLCQKKDLALQAMPTCCAKANKSCHLPGNSEEESHDCTKRDIQYIQQTIPGLIVQSELLSFDLVSIMPLPRFLPVLPTIQSIIPAQAPEPPPNPYGLDLRQQLQSYLC